MLLPGLCSIRDEEPGKWIPYSWSYDALKAYEAYLKGKYLQARATPESVELDRYASDSGDLETDFVEKLVQVVSDALVEPVE